MDRARKTEGDAGMREHGDADDGGPAHELGMMMGIALRFLPQFAFELRTIHRAQASRGATLSKGRLRMLSALVVPLFTSAFRHADTLSAAMDARGHRVLRGFPCRARVLRVRRRRTIRGRARRVLHELRGRPRGRGGTTLRSAADRHRGRRQNRRGQRGDVRRELSLVRVRAGSRTARMVGFQA